MSAWVSDCRTGRGGNGSRNWIYFIRGIFLLVIYFILLVRERTVLLLGLSLIPGSHEVNLAGQELPSPLTLLLYVFISIFPVFPLSISSK